MSARPCDRCGKLVVFAKDRVTDKWLALTNQAATWRIVASKLGVPYVVQEPKILVTHYCTIDQPAASMPDPDKNFSEPRETE